MTPRVPKDLDVAAGKRLRAARMAKGMNQSQLGQAVGLTFQQIQKYEKGANRISVSMLYALADGLGVNVSEILPRAMSDGTAAPDPFAAMGSSIGGYELARIYGSLEPDMRASVLSVAKSMANARSLALAAQAS